MSWFLDPNGKSVAKRAQKVVINLHTQLNKQTTEINELEGIVLNLSNLCTSTIENDIKELEKKKLNLENEIFEINKKINTNKNILNEINLKISKILEKNEKKRNKEEEEEEEGEEKRSYERRHSHNSNDINHWNDQSNNNTNQNGSNQFESNFSTHSHHQHQNKHQNISEMRSFPNNFNHSSHNNNKDDDQNEEEHELLEAVRLIEPNLLFLLYRNNTEDVILYLPPIQSNEYLSIYKLRDPNEKTSREEITSFERLMAYGPKKILNSERLEPDMLQLPCPGLSHDINHLGELMCTITLPIAPKIIIDIWKSSFEKYWATTTIDDVKYAVVEYLYIKSEIKWGFSTVTSIEITGRHPIDGRVLTDEIKID